MPDTISGNVGININPHSLIVSAVSKKIKEKNYSDISCFDILTGITLVLYCQAKEYMMTNTEPSILWGSEREIALRKNLSKQIPILLDEAVKEYDKILESQNKLKTAEIDSIKQKYEKKIEEIKIDNSKFSWEAVWKNKQRILNGIFDKLLYTVIALILTSIFVYFLSSLPAGLRYLADIIDSSNKEINLNDTINKNDNN